MLYSYTHVATLGVKGLRIYSLAHCKLGKWLCLSVAVTCSRDGGGSRGLTLDDGLCKSTECLASLSPDSTLAPASLDRASSQPNLLALSPEDLVSPHRRKKSPRRRRAEKSADDSIGTSKDAVTVTVTGPAADSRGARSSRRRAAKTAGAGVIDQTADISREDGGSCERTGSEDEATEKLAVIDHTLAKVMYGLKTLDALEQNTTTAEENFDSKNADGEKAVEAVASEMVPIIVKSPSMREDRHDEMSSFSSFSRSRKKPATLLKSGSVDTVAVDADLQTKHFDAASHLGKSTEDHHSMSSLSRSDSAPQRKQGGGSVTSPSNIGQSRFEATSRVVPAAAPVVPGSVPTVQGSVAVPSSVPNVAATVPSGPPATRPKPSTAKKPTGLPSGSSKTSRPLNDGKTGGVNGKLAKK